MEGLDGFYDAEPHLRSRSMSVQQPPAFVQWAPQPISGLYQLVPVDGACLGYQPVYPQHQQHQQPPQQPYQQPYQQNHAQAQAQAQAQVQQQQQQHQFYTMPALTMSPVSPTPNFVSPISPLRRQVSLSGSIAGYYQQQQPQGQPQQASPQQQQQQQQSTPFSTSVPAPGPAYMSQYGNGQDVGQSFHVGQMSGQYQPTMLFATPPPDRHDVGHGGRDLSKPLPPMTMPRSATVGSRPGQRMVRPNRPKPLSLSSSTLGRGRSSESMRDSMRDSLREASSSLRASRLQTVPSVTPVGSDHDYDAGGSSYSTSPVGSETNYTTIRSSHRNHHAFGLVSETSEAGTDRPGGRRQSTPRTLRIPTYVQSAAAVADEGPPSPTPRARSLLRTAHGRSRSGLVQPRAPPVLHYHNEDDDDVKDSLDRGVEYSSSDEWYTTSDTNPIQRRHRHRVAADNAAQPGRPGLCNCGMMQCYECGLFISRPETHTCMRAVFAKGG